MAKRQFLHSNLDEILSVWDRGSGKGSFIFIIQDGTPDFDFCTKLDFENVSAAPEDTNHQKPRHIPRRHRGPARRERDRQRAAKFQAAMAAKTAVASPAATFPGRGGG